MTAVATSSCSRSRAGSAKTQVLFSRPGEIDGSRVSFELELGPRERWDLRVDVVASLSGEESLPLAVERRFGEGRSHVQASLDAWNLQVPRLRTSHDGLARSFAQSVADLAALRMRTDGAIGMLPAAGMPWFMTVFGRDTLITSLQTMLLGPELATASLDALAALQAREDDPTIDAEPGKILHELRRGRAAETWFGTYYGTVDATPLYLILLSEVWRWSADPAVVERLREPALAALRWIDGYGDRDGDGFVEYERRTSRGLENQSWKDSGDSQRFRDGRFATTPIAPVEVQGYVYDAKLRMAELARAVWRDDSLAARLETEAAELQRRFDEQFWVEERGGYYALALDGDKQRVDSLCSNIGHLLWSGIVPPERVDAVARPADGRGALVGSRDPHDVDRGRRLQPARLPQRHRLAPRHVPLCLGAVAQRPRRRRRPDRADALPGRPVPSSWSLPEVFAGFRREETPFPIAYPTAARPQAWAAGTPVLMLRLLLGLEPDPHSGVLRTAEVVPEWLDGLELNGVRALGRSWRIAVAGGRVSAETV